MKTRDGFTNLSGIGVFSRLLAATLMLVLISQIANAQSSDERRGWGYGFLAVGGSAGDGSAVTFHYGGGGERLVYRGLGLGAELGNVTPIGDFGHGLGIFSANAYYSFGARNGSRKMIPFVTGGYSVKFRDDEDSGGGVNVGPAFTIGRRVGSACVSSSETTTFSKVS